MAPQPAHTSTGASGSWEGGRAARPIPSAFQSNMQRCRTIGGDLLLQLVLGEGSPNLTFHKNRHDPGWTGLKKRVELPIAPRKYLWPFSPQKHKRAVWTDPRTISLTSGCMPAASVCYRRWETPNSQQTTHEAKKGPFPGPLCPTSLPERIRKGEPTVGGAFGWNQKDLQQSTAFLGLGGESVRQKHCKLHKASSSLSQKEGAGPSLRLQSTASTLEPRHPPAHTLPPILLEGS